MIECIRTLVAHVGIEPTLSHMNTNSYGRYHPFNPREGISLEWSLSEYSNESKLSHA